MFVLRRSEDVDSAGTQNPHNFLHDQVRMKHMLEDILSDEELERTIRKRQMFKILTENPVLIV